MISNLHAYIHFLEFHNSRSLPVIYDDQFVVLHVIEERGDSFRMQRLFGAEFDAF